MPLNIKLSKYEISIIRKKITIKSKKKKKFL